MMKRVRIGADCWVQGVRYTRGEFAELLDSYANDLVVMRRAELAPVPPPAAKPPAPRPAASRKQPTPPKEA